MKDFIKFDLDISKIVLAVKVISSSDHQKTHINRPSHGLALHLGGHKIYHFEDGHDLEVFKDDIIFMPKRSSYEVEVIEASDCYAAALKFSKKIAEFFGRKTKGEKSLSVKKSKFMA